VTDETKDCGGSSKKEVEGDSKLLQYIETKYSCLKYVTAFEESFNMNIIVEYCKDKHALQRAKDQCHYPNDYAKCVIDQYNAQAF